MSVWRPVRCGQECGFQRPTESSLTIPQSTVTVWQWRGLFLVDTWPSNDCVFIFCEWGEDSSGGLIGSTWSTHSLWVSFGLCYNTSPIIYTLVMWKGSRFWSYTLVLIIISMNKLLQRSPQERWRHESKHCWCHLSL